MNKKTIFSTLLLASIALLVVVVFTNKQDSFSFGSRIVMTNRAHASVSYTVTFMDGTRTHALMSVKIGETLGGDMPDDPTREGNHFSEWNTRPDGTGDTFTGETVVTRHTAVYAIWGGDSEPEEQPETATGTTSEWSRSESGNTTGRQEALHGEVDKIEVILARLLEILDEKDSQVSAVPTTEGIPEYFSFTQNLSQGSRGRDVRYLQILFNKDRATQVSQTGAGSPGNETEYFGPATFNAALRFQEKYADEVLKPIGLSRPTGFVGSRTREKLNAILRGEFEIVQSDPPEVSLPPRPEPDPDEEPEPDSDPTPEIEPDPDEEDSDPDEKTDPDEDTDYIPTEGSPCGGQESYIDIRNNERYNLVEIGSLCWFAKNLNYETSGSSCYDNSDANCNTFGRLYTFEAAKDACPSGWRLPSDDDFKELEHVAGMSGEDRGRTGWRGVGEGNKIKSQSDWDGNNEIGFSALPAGGREGDGGFSGINKGVSFWTTTDSGAAAWTRHLYSGFSGINRTLLPKGSGISVRCIKDY